MDAVDEAMCVGSINVDSGNRYGRATPESGHGDTFQHAVTHHHEDDRWWVEVDLRKLPADVGMVTAGISI